jgi:hypothetical protein
MKGIAVFIIFGVLLGSPAGATDPDTWNVWALVGEGVAGLALGAGLAVALSQSDEDDGGPDWLSLSGWAAGNAGGVILAGELFDGRSANWYVTYPVTVVGASVIPVTYGVIAERKGIDFGEALFWALVLPAGTPAVTVIAYNSAKYPVSDTSEARAAVGIQPYAGLLADNGDGYVPVYGLAASF